MIRFLLGHVEQAVSGLDPAVSILRYLRETMQLSGTKNGCSTGDCGACTVVTGEVCAGSMRYRAVNACLTPLGSLHGKQLITVEHLGRGECLHAVQRAMVECHGSQCGFCTPGIVMSLFAHLNTYPRPEQSALIDSLAGNLCRCTGYRPILEAGEKMYTDAGDDEFRVNEAATVAALQEIAAVAEPVEVKVDDRSWRAPE